MALSAAPRPTCPQYARAPMGRVSVRVKYQNSATMDPPVPALASVSAISLFCRVSYILREQGWRLGAR